MGNRIDPSNSQAAGDTSNRNQSPVDNQAGAAKSQAPWQQVAANAKLRSAPADPSKAADRPAASPAVAPAPVAPPAERDYGGTAGKFALLTGSVGLVATLVAAVGGSPITVPLFLGTAAVAGLGYLTIAIFGMARD